MVKILVSEFLFNIWAIAACDKGVKGSLELKIRKTLTPRHPYFYIPQTEIQDSNTSLQIDPVTLLYGMFFISIQK